MLADVTLHRSEENLPETVKRKWFISFGFNVHERFLDYFHFVDYFVSWTFNSSKSFFTAVIQLHQPVQRCSVERDRVIRLSIRVRTRWMLGIIPNDYWSSRTFPEIICR